MDTPKIYGIKEVKLSILREEPLSAAFKVQSPEEMIPVLETVLKDHPYFTNEVEQFFVFLLNTRNVVKGWQLLSTGTLDSVIVHPRDVFKAAIVGNAHSIIIAHNHPSGDPTPSEADIKITRDLIRAGQLLKIDVTDHIVFAPQGTEKMKHVSLKAMGYFYS